MCVRKVAIRAVHHIRFTDDEKVCWMYGDKLFFRLSNYTRKFAIFALITHSFRKLLRN